VRLYRFTHKRHAGDAWSGQGGLKASGRWHTKGRPVVYAAEHAALAVLEALVHATFAELADFRLVEADVPDALLADLDPKELRPGWDAPVHPPHTRALGDAWLASGRSAGLRVPSSLVPGRNVLLNPQHPGFARVSASGRALPSNLPARLGPQG
jgi:RES domain-containing protein